MNEVQVGGVVAGLTALAILGAALAGRWLTRDAPTTPTGRPPGRAPVRVVTLWRRCWSVTVEVAQFGVDQHGLIAYRMTSAPVHTSAAPDLIALELSGLEPTTPGAVVHATSWRYEDAGHLVLTYAALPCAMTGDGGEAGLQVLDDLGILCSPDPLRPAPTNLHQHHVVAHAARHLVYLAEHDPTVREATAAAPAPWSALRRTVNAMPSTDHLDGHALARRWDISGTT